MTTLETSYVRREREPLEDQIDRYVSHRRWLWKLAGLSLLTILFGGVALALWGWR